MSNGLINRQYVGARYVPKIMGEWNKALQYEALSVVTYMGNSFTSKVPVPANVNITNEDYWVNTGNYNAQVEEYRQIVEKLTKDPVNVLMLGVKNDGSEDCSAIINEATKKYDLYFPEGVYLINDTLNIQNNIIGAGYSRYNGKQLTVLKSNIVINDINNVEKAVISLDNANKGITITDIEIKCNSYESGIYLNSAVNCNFVFKDIKINNVKTCGVYASSMVDSSRLLLAENITILADFNAYSSTSVGIRMEQNSYDSRLDQIEIIGFYKGIVLNNGFTTLSNIHTYSGIIGTDTGNLWRYSCGLDIQGYSQIIGTNLYLDTAFYTIKTSHEKAIAKIQNLYVNIDNTINSNIYNDAILVYGNGCVTINNGYVYTNKCINKLTDNANTNITDLEVRDSINIVTDTILRFPNLLHSNNKSYFITHESLNSTVYTPIAIIDCRTNGTAKFKATDTFGYFVDITVEKNNNEFFVTKSNHYGLENVYYKLVNNLLTIYAPVIKTTQKYTVDFLGGSLTMYNLGLSKNSDGSLRDYGSVPSTDGLAIIPFDCNYVLTYTFDNITAETPTSVNISFNDKAYITTNYDVNVTFNGSYENFSTAHFWVTNKTRTGFTLGIFTPNNLTNISVTLSVIKS